MATTVSSMSKTEQVRIPADLARNARIVCAALDETLPEYVARVLREAIARDLPRAAKTVNAVAEQMKAKGG